MPRFDQPRPLHSTKILYLGHTGAGKTGSLASLAAAGYTVRILDLDAGTELLSDYLTNPRSIYRKERPGLWTAEQAASAVERMSYVTITETYRIMGIKPVPRGDSWKKINDQLNNWVDGEEKLGNIATWEPDKVLVIDGLSRLCESAMNFQLAMNGRAATGPQVGGVETNDYSAAYAYILSLLDMFKSTDIKCNVIMICHIRFRNVTPGGDTQTRPNSRASERVGFPQTVGSMLSPQIGQYFNHAIEAVQMGQARRIVTNTSDSVLLKNVAPLRVKASYALETGLAEYFRDIRQGPSAPAGEAEGEPS